MMVMRLYVKSSCITCQKAEKRLKSRGVKYEKVDLFKQPLTIHDLGRLFDQAGIRPRDALRKRDRSYKELCLEDSKLSDVDLLELMVKSPGLIARPIISAGSRAVIANKPAILDSFIAGETGRPKL